MAPDPVRREYLCVWDDPYYGPRTLLVRANDIRAVQERFPHAEVLLADRQTRFSPVTLERMRYAVGPYQDPDAPANARSAHERAQFSAERRSYREALRQSRIAAGDPLEFLDTILGVPLWVELEDQESVELAVKDGPEA